MRWRDLTTGDIGKLYRVTTTTIINWITKGMLRAYQTAGGHYRISLKALRAFADNHTPPINLDFFLLTRDERRVLVVDDDPAIVNIVVSALKTDFPKFIFASANNGHDAIYQTGVFKPDLITLDIKMPGIDGFEVCQYIKTSPRTSGIKILILTGHPENQSIARVLACCGADDYLLKPFNVAELLEKVSVLLNEKDNSEILMTRDQVNLVGSPVATCGQCSPNW